MLALASPASDVTAQSTGAGVPRPAEPDTVPREASSAALGLFRLSYDSLAGVLGIVDTTDAPNLGAGAGIEALAGRIAGAQVYRTSGAAGTPPSVQLFGRTSLDRVGAPLYVLDGVPLAGPLLHVDLTDLDRIDVLSSAVGARWLGFLARDGVVLLRRAPYPAVSKGLFVEARSEVGTVWLPSRPGINRSHAFRVNAEGDYVDAEGTVVTRDLREPDDTRIADAAYPGGTFDPYEALVVPGLVHSASATVGGRVRGARLSASAGGDREQGVLRDGDGYARLFMRGAAEHRFARSLDVSFTGYHARSARDAAEGNSLFGELNRFPADIDLREQTADGEYVARPDTSLPALNPLYVLSSLETPIDGRRTIFGTQVRWSPLAWMSVHAGIGHDALRESSRRLQAVISVDGNETGDTTRFQTAQVTSLRTSAIAAAGERAMGPFAARFGIGWSAATFRDSTLRETSVIGCAPSEPSCPLSSVFVTSLVIRQRVYSAHAALGYDDRFAVDAAVRRESNGLLPAADEAVIDHHVGVAWFPTAESWWPWRGIDRATLRVSQSSQSSASSPFDRAFLTLVTPAAAAGILKVEREIGREVALDLGFGSRAWTRLAHHRSTTRDALAAVPLSSSMGVSYRVANAGDLDRRSYSVSLGGAIVRRDWGSWTATFVADRNRLHLDAWNTPCYLAPGNERRCGGIVAGQVFGMRWMSGHAQLPAEHAGAHNAFAVNDDGLLVPVGVGGSLADAQFGATVTIDGRGYEWGMPMLTTDENGFEAIERIADVNPAVSLGFSNVLRWRGLAIAATLAGELGGDVYDRASQYRYLAATHPDLDQAFKPEHLRKPLDYYWNLASRGNTSWFVRDASRVTLEELSVRYRLTLGNRAIGGVDALELSLIGRNVATWSPHSWIGGGPTAAWPAEDDFRYPRTRSLSLRISATR